MDENMAKAYRIRHQQACLVAYNALEEAWPPDNATEYWERTANRYADIYNECASNPLAKRFMTAVYNYLGDVVKGTATTEDPDAVHKKVFRSALDFLNWAFAEGNGPEAVMGAVGTACTDESTFPLARYLMKAVQEYTPEAIHEMEEAS
jgi:hypothetical protein